MPGAIQTECPHCGARLDAVALPDTLSDHPFDLVCFNDDCPYYVRGWAWMEQQFGVVSSYRHRVDGHSGFASPLRVWSPTAIRSSIIPGGPPASEERKEHP